MSAPLEHKPAVGDKLIYTKPWEGAFSSLFNIGAGVIVTRVRGDTFTLNNREQWHWDFLRSHFSLPPKPDTPAETLAKVMMAISN